MFVTDSQWVDGNPALLTDSLVIYIQAYYIIPCLFYLKAFKEGSWYRWDKMSCYLLIIFCTGFFPTVLVSYWVWACDN